MTVAEDLRQKRRVMWSKQDVLDLLKEKGDDWAIAAVIDGSLGYFSPKGAEILLEQVKENKDWTNFSERCYSLYAGNLLRMVSDDFGWFLEKEGFAPVEVDLKVKSIQALKKMTDMEAMQFGAFYPIGG